MFRGSIPALVTPFTDGAFDEPLFRRFVDWQVAEGSSGLVPCGTTGESATMSIEEHDRVVAVCVEQAAGRVPVIAGCGSNDTRVALEHMKKAQAAGAAAALVVLPYYNRPNQDGIYTIELAAKGDAGNPNYLPIPEKDAYIILRMYGPSKSVQEGGYKFPVLDVVK